jgi:hypothetical protein
MADLERARASTTAPKALGLIYYNLALVHVARKEWPAARNCLNQAIVHGEGTARDLAARLGP